MHPDSVQQPQGPEQVWDSTEVGWMFPEHTRQQGQVPQVLIKERPPCNFRVRTLRDT